MAYGSPGGRTFLAHARRLPVGPFRNVRRTSEGATRGERIMLDLNKLHVFNVVAQAGSFSAAADRLYVTQSAVSQHIKELETGLGRQLFQRGRRGVRLTPHGDQGRGNGEELHRRAPRRHSRALTRPLGREGLPQRGR